MGYIEHQQSCLLSNLSLCSQHVVAALDSGKSLALAAALGIAEQFKVEKKMKRKASRSKKNVKEDEEEEEEQARPKPPQAGACLPLVYGIP